MDTTVFLLVLLAAFLHAAWNVQVKFNLDRFLALFLLQTTMGLFGIGLLAWAGPVTGVSIFYALASGVLHTGYNLFLARSYQSGELSLVYPLARGGAPFLTLLASLLVLREVPTALTLAGILILLVGLLTAGLSGLRRKSVDGKTLFFAGGTAVFIAVYTVVDGLGGRISGNPLAYAGLVYIMDASFLLMTGVALRGPGIIPQVLPFWKGGLLGAGASSAAYAIVIWAMARAPIAVVAALRETSILFALILSARFLSERLSLSRVLGAVLIAAGAILLRVG
ncbi:MAG: DMT family transporter [Hyphomicrobiales bacterium]